MNILEISDVSKRFRGVQALDRCTLNVQAGTVHGIIGPNGAGKSTLMEIVSGGLKPDAGRIVFDGADITSHSRAKVARLGLLRSFQVPRLLPKVTVLENAMIARQHQAGESVVRSFFRRSWVSEEAEIMLTAGQALEEVGMRHKALALANAISGGQAKLLDFGRAFIGDPRLVIFDEPVSGVNPRLRTELSRLILQLKERGTTVVVVEHNLAFLEDICDIVAVMVMGQVLMEGTLDDIRRDRRVVDAYLGKDMTA